MDNILLQSMYSDSIILKARFKLLIFNKKKKYYGLLWIYIFNLVISFSF